MADPDDLCSSVWRVLYTYSQTVELWTPNECMNRVGDKARFNHQVSTSSMWELDVRSCNKSTKLGTGKKKKKKGFAFLANMPLTQLWVESIIPWEVLLSMRSEHGWPRGTMGTLSSLQQQPVPTPPLGQKLELFHSQSLSKAVATGICRPATSAAASLKWAWHEHWVCTGNAVYSCSRISNRSWVGINSMVHHINCNTWHQDITTKWIKKCKKGHNECSGITV